VGRGSCARPLIPPRPRRSFSRPRPAWNAGSRQADIRAQERGLLDLWTNENFFLFGIVGVVLLFAAIVGVVPPPSDPRCTLPWC
jgi:hypothetical protein